MATITSLHVYPIKSCGGISLGEARLGACGLEAQGVADREWMVVDTAGTFLSQREAPELARVRTALAGPGVIEASATGLSGLRLRADEAHPPAARRTVSIWADELPADDAGEDAAAWFSRLLGAAVRLVRFDPRAARRADAGWTRGAVVKTRFADGFPILLIAQASLEDLNRRWTADGRPPLPMARFRPNVVIDGIGAYEEDHLAALEGEGFELHPVKPCPRCSIPSVDQDSGVVGAAPVELLATYRFDASVQGATFGQNAIVVAGEGATLRVGQTLEERWTF